MEQNSGWINDKFAHIRIPKALFWDPEFRDLMPEAKLIYGLMMDRTGLSARNGSRYINEKGETTIIFSQSEIMDRAGCGHDKATKILQQLETVGLIRKRRIGVGRPYEIVVVPMAWAARKNRSDNADKQKPGGGISAFSEGGNTAGNKPKGNNPDRNNPDRWEVKLIRACMKHDSLIQFYPEDLVDRLEYAMLLPFQTEAAKMSVGGFMMDTYFVRQMVQTFDEEQLNDVLQLLETRDVESMTDNNILDLLYDISQKTWD